jgi:UDP-N-acetylglucosamine 2-epimerase (non-hydrolysing)
MGKKIITVVGTRPNFIKITQMEKVLLNKGHFRQILVHTGQHYNDRMSAVFFKELHIREPDYHLHLQPGSVLAQMATLLTELEKVFLKEKPDMILVVGDVNSTLAAALTANKMNIPLAHLESGLRSFDRTMPEEINRVVTDELADIFFVTEQSGVDNLFREGHKKKNVHLVGNTMIDTLLHFQNEIRQSAVLAHYKLIKGSYAAMTMHRPKNVDTREGLEQLVDLMESVSSQLSIVFPIHPRTQEKLKSFSVFERLAVNPKIIILEPLGYFDFQNLILNARVVITDSGGIQEETTFSRIPCITLRPNTERPSTIEIGSNTLIDFEKEKIMTILDQVFSGTYKTCAIPPLWDGHATERVVKILNKVLLSC